MHDINGTVLLYRLNHNTVRGARSNYKNHGVNDYKSLRSVISEKEHQQFLQAHMSFRNRDEN